MTKNSATTGAAFIRVRSIVGDSRIGLPGILPIGPTTWWNGVKSGRFPKPVKLGSRITAWRVTDIEALIEELGK